MGEQQPGEALLHFDVLDDLEARILVRVPVLYQRANRQQSDGGHHSTTVRVQYGTIGTVQYC